jgi:hypothetical protein
VTEVAFLFIEKKDFKAAEEHYKENYQMEVLRRINLSVMVAIKRQALRVSNVGIAKDITKLVN